MFVVVKFFGYVHQISVIFIQSYWFGHVRNPHKKLLDVLKIKFCVMPFGHILSESGDKVNIWIPYVLILDMFPNLNFLLSGFKWSTSHMTCPVLVRYSYAFRTHSVPVPVFQTLLKKWTQNYNRAIYWTMWLVFKR